MTTPTAPSGVTASTGQQEQHRPDKSTSSNSTPQDTKQALIIRCPRCDSSNTKFCYYNNYNLSQPRHFCKTCRRYWTQGGALRNVPVGGGCRKNKKLKSCNSSIPTSSEISSSSGYKFFPSAMDFQLGGGGTPLYGHNHPFGLVDPSAANTTFASPIVFGANPNHRFGVEPSALTMGFNNFTSNQEVGIANFVHQSSSLASSIESLSCINQDMHWKLQQQRLSVLFAADTETQKHGKVSLHSQMQETQPMEMYSSSSASASKGKESGMNNGDMVTEWLFVNSGSSIIPANSMGDDLGKGGNPATSNWSNGVQATWGL